MIATWLSTGCILLTTGLCANAQQVNTIVGNVVNPERRDVSEALIDQLKLPAGFEISVFASGLGNPRMMAFGNDGTLYVTRRSQGDVMMLRDHDGDGRADEQLIVASDLKLVHGITIRENRLYLATPTTVYVSDLQPNGTLANLQPMVENLPDGGQHPNRTIDFGPDGKLYITVGSTCNVCDDSNEESATILQTQPDGSERTIYAKGLRNTIGFGWHPQTQELWGMDHGTDWRGDDQPPEELNRIEQNGNYGWPFCYGEQQPDIYVSATLTSRVDEDYCASTIPPVLTYQAHSAPIGMVFYKGTQFPEEYQNDAFVAMRGSWNRNPATGYSIVRVRFEEGQPARFEDFLTGFLTENGAAHFGRVAGLVVAPDGSLLISEDTNGVIYRVSYKE